MEQWTVPEAVAKRAIASGPECRCWMENINGLISDMEDEWHIRVGRPFSGGTDAFVAPAVMEDGKEGVIRLNMPDASASEDMRKANAAFILADGQGYARLLREDEARLACLFERLGKPLSSINIPVEQRLDILCDTLNHAWITPNPLHPRTAILPHGTEITAWFRSHIPSAWERFHKPLSRLAVDRALAYLDESARRMTNSEAVLLHGDANVTNCLEDPQHPGSFRFIDPDGAIGEKAYDMGMAMIVEQVGFADSPLEIGTARCRRLHERTGIEAAAIWQWGVIQCVSTSLVCLEIDHPAAKALTRIAEAWAATEPFK